MDLTHVFGSARAEHEPDHPMPAARPIPIATVNTIIMKPVNREQLFEMFETGDPKVREFALEASCPRS